MRRDHGGEKASEDRSRPQRLAGSYLASLLLHALAAFFLVSLATSSSEQSAPESAQGGSIVMVTSQAVPRHIQAAAPHAAPPVPHAPVVAQRIAAVPQSAPQHPRILHELSKFAPTAPPNPTPVPVASLAPNPAPTQPEIAASPVPLPIAAPTSAPAQIAAASVRVPPTQPPTPSPTSAPTQKPVPRPVPTAAPRRVVNTPAPQPSAPQATFAPVIAYATPRAILTPGIPQQRVRPNPTPGIANPSPAASPNPLNRERGTNPSPGPKAVGSPGPRGAAPVARNAPARPIQAIATPRPATVSGPVKKPVVGNNINARLKNLIPTGPAPQPTSKHYQGDISAIKPGPPIEPLPPPEVIAATKFIFVENGNKAGYENYVKMYVTSVRHVAFGVNICTGWLLRYTRAIPHGHYTLDSNLDVGPKPIIEAHTTYVCAGHLAPFTPPTPAP